MLPSTWHKLSRWGYILQQNLILIAAQEKMLKKNVQLALRNYQRPRVKQVYSAEHNPTVFALKGNTERKGKQERKEMQQI